LLQTTTIRRAKEREETRLEIAEAVARQLSLLRQFEALQSELTAKASANGVRLDPALYAISQQVATWLKGASVEIARLGDRLLTNAQKERN
jgi:hypothetical protein